MAKLPLDDDDDDEVDTEELLKVNKAYARRLEYNKEREALHRLKELEKRGVVASSDSSSCSDEKDDDEEDEDDGLISERTEAQFFETLAKIRNKDPSIYAEDTKFFDNSIEEEELRGDEDIRRPQKRKPVYLKDALAHQLIDEGTDSDEAERKHTGIVTYSEEQQALKREFLRGAEDPDDEDDDTGFLKVRKKQTSGKEEEGAVNEQTSDIAARLEDYFGKDEKLDENEKFLKEFLRKKSWIVQDHGHLPSYDEIVGDDEEELEKQDKFEAEYNFRYEGDSGWQVLGHSRVVEDSVRRKDDSRRQKRLQKQRRVSEAAFDRREELKRLKNIKKKEILQKLERIRTVAGAKTSDSTLLPLLHGEDLEEDFDAEDYDQKMREVFGEEYYGAEDDDENFQGYEDMQKPDFDAEDDTLGESQSWDDEEHEAAKNLGFAAAREKVNDLYKADSLSNNNLDDGAENAADGPPLIKQVSKRKKKGRISLQEKLAFDKQLEEYYKLDYEDMIGGLPTRFKYHQVKPNTYGLTASEILSADDKELNQFVSLKKLAPYAVEEWKPKGRFPGSQKSRKKRVLKQQVFKRVDSETGYDVGGHVKSPLPLADKEDTKQGADGSEGTAKGKRKRRKKGLSLPESRLIAYGKLSLLSKKRKRI